jgi:uncharacterized protein DUF5925
VPRARSQQGARALFPFSASFSLEHAELVSAVYTATVIERGLRFAHLDGWTTRAKSVDFDGERLFTGSTSWNRSELVDAGDAIVQVALQSGYAQVWVAAQTETRAAELMAQLRTLLPAPDPSGRREVTVTFWTYGPHGPQPSWRTIAVPDWASIESNYPGPARTQLDGLMTSFTPAHGGQLVLWHGASGTGKTFALRALAWEWRDWCDVHYVVDPDSFFGQHADYLMHVLLQSETAANWASFGQLGVSQAMVVANDRVGDGEPDDEGGVRRKDWRLLVLEDTGELLQPDAKAVIGQGLARFLNLVDGLIGQGLRILVLVTTNEEIRKLHPAVARPGRCAADIEFTELSEAEADAWLAAHGSSAGAGRARTVAELYARLEGAEGAKPSDSFTAD